MKLYIWKYKDAAMRMENFYPLSRSSGQQYVSPIAVHAFFRKRDAKAYLNEIGWEKWVQENYELVAIEL